MQFVLNECLQVSGDVAGHIALIVSSAHICVKAYYPFNSLIQTLTSLRYVLKLPSALLW